MVWELSRCLSSTGTGVLPCLESCLRSVVSHVRPLALVPRTRSTVRQTGASQAAARPRATSESSLRISMISLQITFFKESMYKGLPREALSDIAAASRARRRRSRSRRATLAIASRCTAPSAATRRTVARFAWLDYSSWRFVALSALAHVACPQHDYGLAYMLRDGCVALGCRFWGRLWGRTTDPRL